MRQDIRAFIYRNTQDKRSELSTCLCKKKLDKSQSSDITILNVQYSISNNKYFQTDDINEQYLHSKHDPSTGE